MSSILTNTSAIVALQTLKGVNKGLGMVQSQISTGMKIATAKDNASTWAIAQTIRSDAGGFTQIADSLGAGSAAVGVARTASETVVGLLNKMKEKIVAAQSPSADTAKIQTDIVNLRNQIATVVGAAQFNGLNMVDNANTVSILSSLDRTNGGSVTTSTIDVVGQDLSAGTPAAARNAFASANFTAAADGDLLAFSMDAAAANVDQVTIDATSFAAGDRIEVVIGSKVASYTVTAADLAATTPEDVLAVKLKDAIDALGVTGVVTDYDSAAPGVLDIGNDGTGAVDQTVLFRMVTVGSGGLSGIDQIDVSGAAAAAIGLVESALTTAIDAAASLGSAQSRIDMQAEFVGKLIDSMNTGIGALVDADMEEASARLQALQVQQQLGIQSLSIANQQPQSLLSLFR